jgi:L-ascorbate metabolism protein UlaG (beta-lactamase superfamily)
MRIQWLGHASFLVETHLGKRIYVDPWIKQNPVCPITLEEVQQADIVCVTHGHDDHLGDSIEIVQKTGAVLVSHPGICLYAQKYGIGYEKESDPLHIGGTARIGEITITMVQAMHSADILGEEFIRDGTILPGSGCCGFMIREPHSPCLYFTGDTGLFGDMELLARFYAPDIAIMPIGGKYTMGIREAAFATSLIRPSVVIPEHYNTVPNQAADTDEFASLVATFAPGAQVVALQPGETYEC